MNLIQLLTDQRSYEGITHSRWGASWNWWWRRVGDDEERRSPLRSPKWTPDLPSQGRKGLGCGSVSWIAIILSPLFFSGKIGFYSIGFKVCGATRWGQPTWARQERGVRPGGLCPPRCPSPVGLGSKNSYLLYKKFLAKFRSIPRTFISAQKQHHGSSAENNVSSGLVSFKSCKLESKTRAKVLGKVDTMETYQCVVQKQKLWL